MKDVIIKIAIVLIAGLIALTALAYLQQRAEAEDYRDSYREAIATYRHVVPTRYNQIYKDKWQDKSSRRAWVDGARDYCKNTVNRAVFVGPNVKSDHPPFDCYTRF